MKRVACIGDSLTWGFSLPDPGRQRNTCKDITSGRTGPTVIRTLRHPSSSNNGMLMVTASGTAVKLG